MICQAGGGGLAGRAGGDPLGALLTAAPETRLQGQPRGHAWLFGRGPQWGPAPAHAAHLEPQQLEQNPQHKPDTA